MITPAKDTPRLSPPKGVDVSKWLVAKKTQYAAEYRRLSFSLVMVGIGGFICDS